MKCIKCDQHYHHWYDFDENHWMWCEHCHTTMYQNTKIKGAPVIKENGHNPLRRITWEEFSSFLGQENLRNFMSSKFKMHYFGQGMDKPLFAITHYFDKEFEGCPSWLAEMHLWENDEPTFYIYGAPR